MEFPIKRTIIIDDTKKKKENEKHKEEAFETMSVVIVYGSGMFCDNQCQDDNGAGIITDVQIKWQNLYGKA